MYVALTLHLLSCCIPYYVHQIIALVRFPTNQYLQFASITTVNNAIHYICFFKEAHLTLVCCKTSVAQANTLAHEQQSVKKLNLFAQK